MPKLVVVVPNVGAVLVPNPEKPKVGLFAVEVFVKALAPKPPPNAVLGALVIGF